MTRLYVQFSDDGKQIRRWSFEPFEGAVEYEAKRIPPEVWMKIPSAG